jgi:hypothetical protein
MNKRKTLTYCSFMITSLVVTLVFVSATTYIQLAIAILLYLPLAYFAFKVFPRKTRGIIHPKESVIAAVQPQVKPASPDASQGGSAEKVETAEKRTVGIADIDKRVFLKLIGGAGITLFLFSIFNKRSEGLFFKNIPAGGVSGRVALEDIAGNKIDPAQNQPTDGYRISEIDENFVTFYGFTNKSGAWFVMREETDTGSFRYARGDSDFPGNWTGRENLKYDYYSSIF